MYLSLTFNLRSSKALEDLNELCQVGVDQLCLKIEAEQTKEVSFLHLNQLIISLCVCIVRR